ncbi:MAG: mitochondrial fission ELM1 family protein [Coxiellaceae bacterium]|nr:mitochondrial fission ELM1 family protein [Coxiellaceae bacterium]
MDFVATPPSTTEINSKKNALGALNQIAHLKTKTCWIVSDGKTGTENQCLGLAERLEMKPIIKRINLKEPWKSLVPWFRFGLKQSFSKKSSLIEAPWPDLLIASGRQSTSAALYVKAQNPKTVVVQIQSPGISSKYFDLLVVPRHDNIERFIHGSNVIKTKGALHRITLEFLAREATRFSYLVAHTSKPRIAVLIGGPNRFYKLTPSIVTIFCEQLLQMQYRENVSLLVTPSRRTGDENIAVLHQHLGNKKDIILCDRFDDPENPNPYYGFLGLCDAIIATSDSVSMISEACATQKPVHIFHLPGGCRKFNTFHEALRSDGITRDFDGKLEYWKYAQFDDLVEVTVKVHELLYS